MSRRIRVILTSQKTSDRLSEKKGVAFKKDIKGVELQVINIFPEVAYQEIEGFGGALTESAAITLERAGAAIREEVLQSYFNTEKGLNYSLCRVHINSCDFSTGNYHYTARNDRSLKTFSIDRDRQLIIPMIRAAQKIRGSKLKILSSPWSPPGWMKTTGRMNLGGKLRADCRKAWAEYYCRYISEYAKEGITVSYITVQNEPKAKQTWDSCLYTAEEERDFVKNYLGPALKKNGLGHVRLLIWDHNKERVFDRSMTILSDRKAAQYIWGTGFHWYSGDHFEGLSILHDLFPGKGLIFTEGAFAVSPAKSGWDRAEKYAHDIIGDLNNWTQAWIDWNIALDEQGGPNHVGNFCHAPVSVDTTKGEAAFTPPFYYIGHFSKFILPGARRIAFSRFTQELEVTAARNPSGEIVAVVMNRTGRERNFILRCEQHVAELSLAPHSIMTLLFKAE
ncbi:MAG: glycoside hydrolase family 30 protein [Kiritimatiellae bacterium]|nr:glycoside hydrolase family 30 protein [Kiritimatiellia bacterium]